MNIIKITYLLDTSSVSPLLEDKKASDGCFKKPRLQNGKHEFPYFRVKRNVKSCQQITFYTLQQVAMMISSSPKNWKQKEEQLLAGRELNSSQLNTILSNIDDTAFDLGATGWKFEFIN